MGISMTYDFLFMSLSLLHNLILIAKHKIYFVTTVFDIQVFLFVNNMSEWQY